ncbi:stearoyl-CoA desaturase 5-like isoform X2 [Balaenoptera acutorostrata]|uniref:Stearoyl-CoA desaturase 5-like isoform X2 n=1 Tax=Balaenoptera acutorostrata TaxID=9767 RepID=A0ABM3TK28_BALAC|nr:stearoyl-CoA desaturase 5-like isoform X2 [Balaenoptera acutorostrata]
MPGPAADEGKVPFRTAKEEIRVGLGVEGSEGGGGGREKPGARGRRQDIAWRNVFLLSLLHLGAVYSLALIPKAQPLTLLWDD